MLVCITQGSEAGMVKDLDAFGGRHAVATGFARLATKDEAKAHDKAAKAHVKAEKATEAAAAKAAKGKGKKETRELEGESS